MYYLIITLTIVSFILGILGLIMIEYPIILVIHRVLSIGLVFIYISFIEDLPLHNVTAFIMLKVDDRKGL